MTSAERTVQVSQVDKGNAATAFSGTGDMLLPAVLSFVSTGYRYFLEEHALVERDLVVHFFTTEQQQKTWDVNALEQWWLNTFACTLSAVACDYFQAGPPRIMAKYTKEVASWWFKAQGFDHLLDLSAFLHVFFERLDETLHAELLAPGALPPGRV
jgi:hypothetical protein